MLSYDPYNTWSQKELTSNLKYKTQKIILYLLNMIIGKAPVVESDDIELRVGTFCLCDFVLRFFFCAITI